MKVTNTYQGDSKFRYLLIILLSYTVTLCKITSHFTHSLLKENSASKYVFFLYNRDVDIQEWFIRLLCRTREKAL